MPNFLSCLLLPYPLSFLPSLSQSSCSFPLHHKDFVELFSEMVILLMQNGIVGHVKLMWHIEQQNQAEHQKKYNGINLSPTLFH